MSQFGNKINVVLKTSFGKFKIGEICLSAKVNASIMDDLTLIESEYIEELGIEIDKIGTLWTVANEKVYLYQITRFTDNPRISDFEEYFVRIGALYDNKGKYYNEVEVGELIGKDGNIASSIRAFSEKAIQIIKED